MPGDNQNWLPFAYTFGKGEKKIPMSLRTKIVTCMQNTRIQARLKYKSYFRPKWSQSIPFPDQTQWLPPSPTLVELSFCSVSWQLKINKLLKMSDGCAQVLLRSSFYWQNTSEKVRKGSYWVKALTTTTRVHCSLCAAPPNWWIYPHIRPTETLCIFERLWTTLHLFSSVSKPSLTISYSETCIKRTPLGPSLVNIGCPLKTRSNMVVQ